MDILGQLDQALSRAIGRITGGWQPVMTGISLLGEPAAVLTLGLVGLVISLQQGNAPAVRAFILSGGAYGLNTLLKLVLRRERPGNLSMSTLGVRSYSFPSGHAFGTVIFYGLFSYLDFSYSPAPWNAVVALVLWSLIFVIGVSRVSLKIHYPTDVLGGWLLGLLSLLVIIAVSFQ